MTGRKPKPTELKRLEGNPGKRRLNENEPQPAVGCDAPEWLTPGAAAEWGRVYPELIRLGLLTIVDRAAFAAYCLAVDVMERATRAMAPTEENPLPELTEKLTRATGAEALRREAMKTIKSFATEFGFTPASRSRIEVKMPEGDELEALVSDEPN